MEREEERRESERWWESVGERRERWSVREIEIESDGERRWREGEGRGPWLEKDGEREMTERKGRERKGQVSGIT